MQLTVSTNEPVLVKSTILMQSPVCNPFGGLGLTGGIVDVGGLYDCLAGIYDGKADTSILDKYSEIRRQKYNDIVNPVSSENLIRLHSQDPDKALENDEFLKLCKKAEADSEFSRKMQSGVNILKYDFTQHYHTGEKTPTPTSADNSNDIPIIQSGVVAGISD